MYIYYIYTRNILYKMSGVFKIGAGTLSVTVQNPTQRINNDPPQPCIQLAYLRDFQDVFNTLISVDNG